jgi:uncharacterized RDD family membrane protein YckC
MNISNENNTAQTQETVEYAGFWRRFLAHNIDLTIGMTLGGSIQRMLGNTPMLDLMKAESLEEIEQLQAAAQGNWTTILALTIGLLYYLIFLVNYDGATPGKRLMGIKIVREDGSNLSYPVAFIRYLGNFLSSSLFGLGFLWIAWDQKKQSWHDKLAKTIVIKTDVKPKKTLAIIVTILNSLIILSFLGYMGYKGAQLATELVEVQTELQEVKKPAKTQEDKLSPEAQIHWDAAQELFKEMNIVESENDKNKLIPLANKTIQELTKATELDPKKPKLWIALTDAYLWPNTLGTREDALNAAKKAAELEPRNVIYSNKVGIVLIFLERYEEAVLEFKQSLRFRNDSAYAHFHLAVAYTNLDLVDLAIQHYQEAINIYEEHNQAGEFDSDILSSRQAIVKLTK